MNNVPAGTDRYFLTTHRLGFRYTGDEFFAPTGCDRPGYLLFPKG